MNRRFATDLPGVTAATDRNVRARRAIGANIATLAG